MSFSSEILQLPRDERLRCMEELWSSLKSDEMDSPSWHKTILEERMAKVESGEAKFISGSELRKRLDSNR